MTEPTTEPTEPDTDELTPEVTPDPETEPPAEPETETEPETFPAAYVKELRDENKTRRLEAKEATDRAEDLAKRLHTALVTATGRLADPTDLPYDPEHLEDPDNSQRPWTPFWPASRTWRHGGRPATSARVSPVVAVASTSPHSCGHERERTRDEDCLRTARLLHPR